MVNLMETLRQWDNDPDSARAAAKAALDFSKVPFIAVFIVVTVCCAINVKNFILRIYELERNSLSEVEKYGSSERRQQQTARDANKDRKPGEWTPEPFCRPVAKPFEGFSLETTKPLPYRPFRWGPTYPINMGIRSMPWDEWIELDNTYAEQMAVKRARLQERGDKLYQTLDEPRVRDGALELLEELGSFLCQRYPTVFQPLHANDDGRRGVVNIATDETHDFADHTMDPMERWGRLVPEDVALLFESPQDGQYYLLAGSIIIPGSWRLVDKFGKSLSFIHTSGNVPSFKEKLEKSMMSFFKRLRPESPWVRNNYFFQIDGNLGWAVTRLGDEDGEHGSVTAKVLSKEKNRPIEDIHFRTERQTLRRLPRSGAVAFTIRTYFVPVVEIAEEPYVPGRLLSAMRSWPENVVSYKDRSSYNDVVSDFLDRKHQEQVMNGLDLLGEKAVSKYPF